MHRSGDEISRQAAPRVIRIFEGTVVGTPISGRNTSAGSAQISTRCSSLHQSRPANLLHIRNIHKTLPWLSPWKLLPPMNQQIRHRTILLNTNSRPPIHQATRRRARYRPHNHRLIKHQVRRLPHQALPLTLAQRMLNLLKDQELPRSGRRSQHIWVRAELARQRKD